MNWLNHPEFSPKLRPRKDWEIKEGTGNENGKIENNRKKGVYSLCVGKLEINIGYLWELMIFINMR